MVVREIAIAIAIGGGVFDTTPAEVDGARPVRRPDAGHSFGEGFRRWRRVDAVGEGVVRGRTAGGGGGISGVIRGAVRGTVGAEDGLE